MRAGPRLALGVWVALALPVAQAAGGHHAVDDATMIEPGQCEFETWLDRARRGGRTLLHAGAGCRVGPVELGLGWDRERTAVASTSTGLSPQLKWTTQVAPQWSTGIVLWSTWRQGGDSRAGYQGSTLLVPVTWQPAPSLAVHLNAGRDFNRTGPDGHRAGAALEWTPVTSWSLVGERYREGGASFWRLGTRWAPSATWSLDLSRASALAGDTPQWWTLGLKLAFDH